MKCPCCGHDGLWHVDKVCIFEGCDCEVWGDVVLDNAVEARVEVVRNGR